MTVVERFLKYVSYPTASDKDRPGKCSTDGQYVLAKELQKELYDLGLTNISINDYGIVCSYLPGTLKDTIALLAHMDTSPSASGENIKPRIIENYDGRDIVLNSTTIMQPAHYESLQSKKGHRLIVTDGSTLLGGDDKAGIAIIMTALDEIRSEQKDHHNLEIIFTTDEEIGTGVHHVETDKIQSAYGYTVDGGSANFINKANFNAVNLKVTIKGKNIHPGSAKNKMINAITLALNFDKALPQFERPEFTSGREGFYHLSELNGNEEEAQMEYIIRDFSQSDLDHRIYLLQKTAEETNKKLGYESLTLDFNNCYSNMESVLQKKPAAVDRIIAAYQNLGLEYEFEDIRGGTDGSQLSYRGLPCPNIGTGDYNCHGRYEYVDIDEMETMVKVVKEMITRE